MRANKGKSILIGESEFLNEKSISDLIQIREKLIREKIKIDDLQFLIDFDGSVVIADPLKVLDETPSPNNLAIINGLIDRAKQNIKNRK